MPRNATSCSWNAAESGGPHQLGTSAMISKEAAAAYTHVDLVEEGIVERPAPSLGQWDVEVRRPRPARDRMGHDRSTRAIREGEPQGEGTRGRVVQAHVHADTGEVGARREMHELQRVGAPCFEIHGLPHAPRFSVALFPLRLERIRSVVHADDELLAFAEPRVLQLERKRGVAALVLAQLLAVEPRGGAPVRRTEHEKHPSPAPGLRNGDIAGIRSDVPAIRNAREW